MSQHTLLPDELLIQIFSWLSPEDVIRNCRVCKKWNALGRDRMLWLLLTCQNCSSRQDFETNYRVLRRKFCNNSTPCAVDRNRLQIEKSLHSTVHVLSVDHHALEFVYECATGFLDFKQIHQEITGNFFGERQISLQRDVTAIIKPVAFTASHLTSGCEGLHADCFLVVVDGQNKSNILRTRKLLKQLQDFRSTPRKVLIPRRILRMRYSEETEEPNHDERILPPAAHIAVVIVDFASALGKPRKDRYSPSDELCQLASTLDCPLVTASWRNTRSVDDAFLTVINECLWKQQTIGDIEYQIEENTGSFIEQQPPQMHRKRRCTVS